MKVIIATLALGILGVAQWAIQTAPPSQAVLVVRQNLAAGQRIVASDITVGSIRVPPGHGIKLLPASLAELVTGEYLTSSVAAGSPLLTTQIAHVHRTIHVLRTSASDSCAPARGV